MLAVTDCLISEFGNHKDQNCKQHKIESNDNEVETNDDDNFSNCINDEFIRLKIKI